MKEREELCTHQRNHNSKEKSNNRKEEAEKSRLLPDNIFPSKSGNTLKSPKILQLLLKKSNLLAKTTLSKLSLFNQLSPLKKRSMRSPLKSQQTVP